MFPHEIGLQWQTPQELKILSDLKKRENLYEHSYLFGYKYVNGS